MRFAVLLCVAGLFTCVKTPQRLDSPCADDPAANANQCPACTTDDECAIMSNPCQAFAACVPKKGNWAVILIGCDESHEYARPEAECGCVNSVCRAK